MWRFLLPASMLMGALVVLLAGALGDLRSLPDLTAALHALRSVAASDHANTTPSEPEQQVRPQAASIVPIAPSRALQEQAGELQKSVAQQSQELASLRTSVDQARQELDALQQKRRTEEAAIATLQSQERKTASPAPQQSAQKMEPHQGTQTQTTPAQANEAATRAALARAKAAVKSEPGSQSQGPPTQPFGASQAGHMSSETAGTPAPSLMLRSARQLLAMGRAADARQMLMQAQAQSALQPVTPDSPYAAGNSMAASRIGEAIRWLDAGNTMGAMQAISVAMGTFPGGPQAWSGYSPSGPPGYDSWYSRQ